MKKVGKIFLYLFLIGVIILSILFIIVMIQDYKEKNTSKKNIQITELKNEEKEEEEKRLSLVMVGDSLIHEAVYNRAKQSDGTYDFTSMFTEVKPLVEPYDLAFYNQESILGGKEIGLSHYPRFNSPYEVGDAFIDMGFNLISLANNHTLDRGVEAINNSLNYWSSKDVYTAGSYASFEQRDNIKIFEKNGITYALLAYTTVTNGLTRPVGSEYYLNVYNEEQVKKDIESIRSKVDLLLVSMHFGTEYTLTQTVEQENIASYLASLDVDIVIGHHPHVIEPITYIDDTLVIYSLGNFISAQLTTDQLTGLMVGVDVVKEKPGSKIILENLRANLTYTQTRNPETKRFEFRVIPYNSDVLTNEILENKEIHKEKYINVIKSLGVDINIE